jgi:hypothetical protein
MNVSKTQMTMIRWKEKFQHSASVRIVVIASLVGVVHALVNCLIQFVFFRSSPAYVFQFASSTLMGTAAFEGGIVTALLGMALYMAISFVFVSLFFGFASRISTLVRFPMISGVVYGLLVWTIVNLIIIPASAAPPLEWSFVSAYINGLIYIGTIGIPITHFAHKFYVKSTSLRHS